MKNRHVIMKWILVPILAFAGWVPTVAQQTFIVKLLSDTVPEVVRTLSPRTLLPSDAALMKTADRELSVDQQQAWAAVSRYRVVTVTNDAERSALLADEGIEFAYPSRRIPLHEGPLTNDSLVGQQYALKIVGAPRAWAMATGSGIVVGVLDTGVDWTHPDLVNRLAVNADEDINGTSRFEPWLSTQEIDGITGDLDGIDNDGNGYPDDVIGYDLVDQDIRNIGDDRTRDAVPFDEQGHGTSVAGVIAAEADNNIGIAGLARDARILALRAFDATGNADEDDIAAALIYAAVNKVRVVNLSFGDGVDSPAMRDAVRLANAMGCVLIASAGNTGTISRQFPAGYDEVLTVGATNEEDLRAPFSSTGSIVNMSAPGQNIVTTRVGGSYRTVNGTSFAAPQVAAAAAMLIQQRPNITPLEVRSILMESSVDLGERGWDASFGNGRLQIDAALAMVGTSAFTLTTPRNEDELSAGTAMPFSVTGTTLANQFNGFAVYLGVGVEPNTWVRIGEGSESVLDGRLASLELTDSARGTYVVRLAISQQSGRTIETRRRINYESDEELRIVASEITYAWKDDRQFPVVTVRTNRPTQCTVWPMITGADEDTVVTDIRRFSRLHSLLVDVSPWPVDGEVVIRCRSANGDEVQITEAIRNVQPAAPVVGWNTVGSGDFAGYVLDDVRDLYDDGTEVFTMGDLSSGSFGPMQAIQRQQFDWVVRHETADVWIPRGIGDANGNGRLDVLAHVVGQAALFESDGADTDPFKRIIFELNDGRSNAAGMADIDGDGLEDLLILSDSGVAVHAFRSGQFVRIGMADNPTPPAPGASRNRVDEISIAAADFDGDGRMEIAFGDTDGDLVIAEFTGSAFRTEFTHEGNGVGGSGYVAQGDVDGDGQTDIIHGVPDDPSPGPDGEYGRQLWTYTLYKAVGSDAYNEVWTDRFHGVRYGIGYRNGVDAGQLDMKGGDEIIICAFPHLWVFSWEEGRGMKPRLYATDAVSPRFLTHDFNGNGVNELGFGITVPDLGYMSSFTFLEYQDQGEKLAAPSGVRAAILSDASAPTGGKVMLSWFPVEDAEMYRVFGRPLNSGPFRPMDTVGSTSIYLDTLTAASGLAPYEFQVSAIAPLAGLPESSRSASVFINMRSKPTEVVAVTDTVTLADLAQGASVSVTYDQPMSEHGTPPVRFTLSDPTVLLTAGTVLLAGDNVLVVTFDPTSADALGDTLMFTAGEVRDRAGMVTEASQHTIFIDRTAPPSRLFLSSLAVVTASTLELTYSESVTDDALQPGNYELQPTGMVETVERIDERAVRLNLSTDPPLAALGTTYYLTATDVTAASGTVMTTGPGATLSFVLTGADLEDVFVYPHPVHISTDGVVTFANLTAEATVDILDQRFKVVATIDEVDGNGGASWNLTASDGQIVPPGMYFYRVSGRSSEGASGESGLKKLMIRR